MAKQASEYNGAQVCESIIAHLGDMGPYQRRLIFLIVLANVTQSTWMLGTNYTMGTPQYRCAVPGLLNDTYHIQSEAHAKVVSANIPIDAETGGYSQCLTYSSEIVDNPAKNITRAQISCSRWVYSTDVFETSIISQLNLVCGRSIYISHANMMSMAGLMLGSLISGPVSDNFGRKRTFLIFYWLLSVISIASVFVTSVPTLLFVRFLGTAACIAAFCGIWLIGIEMVVPKWRVLANFSVMYGMGTGLLLNLFVAYFVRNWKTLHLIVEVPKFIITVSYIWLLPESPRWLMCKGRNSEAKIILRTIAKVNRVTFPESLVNGASDQIDHADEANSEMYPSLANNQADESTSRKKRHQEEKAGLQLLKSSTMMIRMTVLCLNWVVGNMVYFGLMLNVGSIIEGSLYLNILIIGILELSITVVCTYLLGKGGRKTIFCACVLLGGGACIATIVPLIVGGANTTWVNMVLANIGKLGITGAFATTWMYTTELLPTSIRQSGVGVCGFFGRVGGMVSPYIARLDTLIGGPVGKALPLVVFGAFAVIAGVLSLLFLPETANRKLPETIKEAESMRVRGSHPFVDSSTVSETDAASTAV